MMREKAFAASDKQAERTLPCIAVYSTLFPSSIQPNAGLFIRERMFRMAPHAPLVVVSPQPWFPFQSLISRFRPGYRPMPPSEESQQGVTVLFPRFLALPGLLRRLDGISMALCTLALMRRLRRDCQIGIIDAHFAYPCGYAASRLGKWLNLPVSITLRGTEVRQLKEPALKARVLDALRAATRVFSVSDSLRRLVVAHGISPEHVAVVGNGVDLQKFSPIPRSAARQDLKIEDDAPVLVTVGGLVERKGFHRVIDLLPKLIARFPTLRYLVVGGPSPEGDLSDALRDQVRKLGLEHHVSFTGPMPPDRLHVPLSAADIFVLSTRNEGWANVFLEAMACGLPVVTTNVGGNAEVVNGPELGEIVPFGDPDALYVAIVAALERRWDREKIIAYARANTWDERIALLRGYFHQMLPTDDRPLNAK